MACFLKCSLFQRVKTEFPLFKSPSDEEFWDIMSECLVLEDAHNISIMKL